MAFELIQKNFKFKEVKIIDMPLLLESPFSSNTLTLMLFFPDAPTVSPARNNGYRYNDQTEYRKAYSGICISLPDMFLSLTELIKLVLIMN
jgi:hypothetical protein